MNDSSSTGRAARAILAAFALASLLLVQGCGIICPMLQVPKPQVANNPSPTPDRQPIPNGPSETAPTGPVEFTIHDRLGEGQVSERVELTIDGRQMGTINVDAYTKDAFMRVSVPEGGPHPYSVQAKAIFKGQDGKPVEVLGSGEGTLNVEPGKEYELAGEMKGNTWQIVIQERQTGQSQ